MITLKWSTSTKCSSEPHVFLKKHLKYIVHHQKSWLEALSRNHFMQLISFNKGPFYYYLLRIHHTIKKRHSDHSALPCHASPDYRIQEAFLSLARCPVNGSALPLLCSQENPGEEKRQTCSTPKTTSRWRHFCLLQISAFTVMFKDYTFQHVYLTWRPRTVVSHHPQYNIH